MSSGIPVRVAPKQSFPVNIEACNSVTGLDTYFSSGLATTVQVVKSTFGRLYCIHAENPNPVKAYIQFFDIANVILGTTTPKKSLLIPAYGGYDFNWLSSVTFNNAILIAATTTATGNISPTTGLVVNIDYK